MSGAHEKLEQAEHAAHHGGNNKLFGVTMALMGVLIAFSAAMVGSERNELTRTMIEQTQAHSDYAGASMKLRLVMIELEKQHARIAAARDPQGGWSPVPRFIELAKDYIEERRLSKLWADSFQSLVDAHFEAAEGFERAQLVAEIGIVMASLGVLLASRAAWLLSVALGVLCLGQVARVYFPTRQVVEKGLAQVHGADEAYQKLRKAHTGANQDQQAIERLDPDGSIRAALANKPGLHAPVEEPKESKK
jgi:hypothetical protein